MWVQVMKIQKVDEAGLTSSLKQNGKKQFESCNSSSYILSGHEYVRYIHWTIKFLLSQKNHCSHACLFLKATIIFDLETKKKGEIMPYIQQEELITPGKKNKLFHQYSK